MAVEPINKLPVIKVVVREVRIGVVAAYGPDGEDSAYCKETVPGPVAIDVTGLAGDEQADRQHHGGIDKAILHYDFDHYSQWRVEQPRLAGSLNTAGAFGENISTSGISEINVCLGDRFRLGTALVEVSQGRQPCWKLGHRFGDPRMVAEVLRSARGGWYYRVVEPGMVSPGDPVILAERPCPDWTVARLFATLFTRAGSKSGLEELVSQKRLATSWRERARRLLAN